MAFGTPVVGTTAYSASAGTSVAPAYPAGILDTDELVMFIGQKPSAANGGTATTPTGWTLRDGLTAAGGYGTTLGADTGNTNLWVYTKDTVTAGQSGTQSVTLSGNGVSWAFIVRVPTGGGAVTYGTADGQRTTTPTSPMSIALTNGTSATNFKAGDLALWAMCIPTDVTTPSQFSAQGITATGVTFDTAVELNEPDSTTGNDIGGYSAYATVVSGSSTTAPTVTTTIAGTLTNVRGPVVLLRLTEAQAISFDAQDGAFTLTGQDATLSEAHVLPADTGSYAYTGQDATLTITVAAKELDAEVGSFTYTGQAATLTQRYAINAQAGSFALTGQATTLIEIKALNAQAGAFSYAGQSATLTQRYAINAQVGSFVIAGQDATLVAVNAWNINAAAGSFAVIGQSATLTETKVLAASSGSFVVTGQPATFGIASNSMATDAGVFQIAGTAASMLRRRVFPTSAGVFDSANLYVTSGYYNPSYVSGETATLTRTYSFSADSAAFLINGLPASLGIIRLYPDPSDVRIGVSYGPDGMLTGTMISSKAVYLFDD